MIKSLTIIVVSVILTLVAVKIYGTVTHRGSIATGTAIGPMQVVPRWIAPATCEPMNTEERTQEELAVTVMRTFKGATWMHIGAVRYLGREAYRSEGKKPALLCRPKEMDAEIAALAVAQGIFARSYLHADETRLARRVGARDAAIVAAVGRTGFNKYPISTEYPELKRDIRTLARTTLAEFGAAGSAWSEQAFSTDEYR
jgi:hypothetical protein